MFRPQRCSTLVALLLAVAVGVTLTAPPASAGIIVTEGKITTPAATALKATRRRVYVAPSSTPTPSAANSAYATHDDDQADEPDDQGLPGELSDLDGPPPPGYTCQLLAGGLEVCEPTSATSPLTTGGATGASVETAAAQGCQGGASSALAGLLLALGGWLFTRRGRRVQG